MWSCTVLHLLIVCVVICTILVYCNIMTCFFISHCFVTLFLRYTKCTCMYVYMFISRWTLIHGVSQFLALIIVHKINHKNIQMLHIHLMVVCRNGHSHGQTLVLFLVSTVTRLNSVSSVVPLVCSNSQNYDLKLVYIQFPSLDILEWKH